TGAGEFYAEVTVVYGILRPAPIRPDRGCAVRRPAPYDYSHFRRYGMDTRVEKDSMGEMSVPADAHYGASTARAVENFPISDLRFDRRFIAALGLIKWSCAQVNHDLALLDDRRRQLIHQAAQEVIDGKLDREFVVDIF